MGSAVAVPPIYWRAVFEVLDNTLLYLLISDCHGNSDTRFVQGTILEPSTSHIGREVALVAWATALVYINARHSQIAEMITHHFLDSDSVGRGLGKKRQLETREEATQP